MTTTKQSGTPAARSQSAPSTRSPDGDPGIDETKITRHLLLVAHGAGRRALDSIHQDLFDSSSRVIISALEAIAAIGDPSSVKFVAKLLGRSDKSVVLQAIRTIGALKSPVTARLLFQVYRTTRNDEVRYESLRALATADPENQELLKMLQEQARSPLASDELRGVCGVLRVELEGTGSLSSVFANAPRETIDRVFEWSKAHAEARQPVIAYGLVHYSELEPAQRALLMDIVALTGLPASREVVLTGLKDETPEVRLAAYRATDSTTIDPSGLSALVEILSGKVESDYPIEEEAIAAISRLDAGGVAVTGRPSPTHLLHQAKPLFQELSAQRNRVGSEAIELGWLILKSADYVEYYADEEFRQALVRYLKGGSYHSTNELLVMLKKTAERVEVRHFDGYKALADIIKNPTRPGIALVVRELNIAKLGKRKPFGCLVRDLHLLRLSSSLGKDGLEFTRRVFTWARDARLYRLAEPALYVLAKFDPASAASIVRTLLALPIQSKILAIASARILRNIEVGQVLPSIERVVQGSTDSHVLLNLVDALRACEDSATPGILAGMITLARTAPDIEVARAAGGYLATRPVANLLTRVTEGFVSLDEAHQAVVLDAIKLSLEQATSPNVEALSEFLYGFLRASRSRLRGVAAALLLRLGDKFASKVISRLLAEGDNETRSDMVRELTGVVDPEIVSEILKLITEPHAGLHEAVRRALSSVTEPETTELIRSALIDGDRRDDASGETAAGDDDLQDLDAGIMKEKRAFRFEHEFTKDLAVMFTDIQGYSAKAQRLTTLQVNSLIQDYEAILLPTVEAHRGRLIKRMGDGHLFVFEGALDAGLAALRLQKALKRFNSYREEILRVVVRVGIHYGQVVQRRGDVFGNNVNIASRLESSAKGGSALVSKAVWERWQGHIHARELGKITVKNISEPIAVYEPYEIQIDLPPGLDPLQGRRDGDGRSESIESSRTLDGPPAARPDGESTETSTEPSAGDSARKAITVDSDTVRYLSEIFERLDTLCVKIEKGEIAPKALRSELGRSWSRFEELVVAGLQEEE